MRQHGSLGHAGRTAGVLEDRGVLGADVHRSKGGLGAHELCEGMLARGAVDRRAVPLPLFAREREQHTEKCREVLLDVGEDQVPNRRPVARRTRDGVEPRERDERLGPGVRELPAQLGRGVKGVAWDHDRARAQRAIEGDDELRAVGQEQRDAIAFANAERLEARGEAVREAIEFGVGQRRFDEPTGDDRAEDRRDRARVARGGVCEELLEGDPGICERTRHAGVIVLQPRALGRDPGVHLSRRGRYRSTGLEGHRSASAAAFRWILPRDLLVV